MYRNSLRHQGNARTNHRARMFLTCEQLWSCSPSWRISRYAWISRICKYIVSFPDIARAGDVKEQQQQPKTRLLRATSRESEKVWIRSQALQVQWFSKLAIGLHETGETQMWLDVSFSDNLLCLHNFLHFLCLSFVLIFVQTTMTSASVDLIAAVKAHSWS